MPIINNIVAIALVLISTAVIPSQAAPAASSLPIVDLRYAVHRATVNNTGYPYYNFSNIRYGAAPVGNRRFATPLPPMTINRTVNDGQNEIRCIPARPMWQQTAVQVFTKKPIGNSSQVPPFTPSTSALILSSIPAQDPRTSEDCLFLDVIAPKSVYDSPVAKYRRGEDSEHDGKHNSTGAAVLVWIHGGGYALGSKAEDGNPASLIARARDDGGNGIIYVAINYRLGLYGWLSGPTFQENGTANAGLYDQRLALEWVQSYIHLFGGDKNRVTVMGQSAGGGSIEHQITAYGGLKGKAPFQQAIVQSPGFFQIPSNKQQEATFQQTLQHSSIIAGRQITTLEQLRSLNSTQLYLTNAVEIGLAPYGTYGYGPAVDGKFVPKLPGELLLHGQFDKSVKVMTGHVANEGFFFTSPFIQNEMAFRAFIAQTVPAATNETINYIVEVLYPPVFNGSYGYKTQYDRTSLVISEFAFSCNTRYLATAFNSSIYAYFFDGPLGGIHGEDVEYTFFNGDAGTPVPQVAPTLQDYITSFAMNGNPNEPGVPFFPLYGANSTVTNITAATLGAQTRDPTANARCAWWQKALFY